MKLNLYFKIYKYYNTRQ